MACPTCDGFLAFLMNAHRVWPRSQHSAQTSWGVGHFEQAVLAGVSAQAGGGGERRQEALPQPPPMRVGAGSGACTFLATRALGLGADATTKAGAWCGHSRPRWLTQKLQPAEAPRDWAPPQPPHWQQPRALASTGADALQPAVKAAGGSATLGDDVIRPPSALLPWHTAPSQHSATAMRATRPATMPATKAQTLVATRDSLRIDALTTIPLRSARRPGRLGSMPPYFAVRARS